VPLLFVILMAQGLWFLLSELLLSLSDFVKSNPASSLGLLLQYVFPPGSGNNRFRMRLAPTKLVSCFALASIAMATFLCLSVRSIVVWVCALPPMLMAFA
jgi:hypothetical protein